MNAKYNLHACDFRCDFTIEFDVKVYGLNIPEHLFEYYEREYYNSYFRYSYVDKWYKEIMRSDYNWIKDWSFAGRSSGWIVLLCTGDSEAIQQRTINRLEVITEKYLKNYEKKLIAYLQGEYKYFKQEVQNG